MRRTPDELRADSAERRRTAYHEAGHAVAAVVLYGAHAIRYATLAPMAADRQYEGRVRTPSEPGDLGAVRLYSNHAIPVAALETLQGGPLPVPVEEMLIAQGVYSEAGEVAEAILDYHDHVEEHEADGLEVLDVIAGRLLALRGIVTDDRARLAAFARGFGLKEPDLATLASYWDRAAEILRARWPAVEALAAALLERVTLDGAEVDRIV